MKEKWKKSFDDKILQIHNLTPPFRQKGGVRGGKGGGLGLGLGPSFVITILYKTKTKISSLCHPDWHKTRKGSHQEDYNSLFEVCSGWGLHLRVSWEANYEDMCEQTWKCDTNQWSGREPWTLHHKPRWYNEVYRPVHFDSRKNEVSKNKGPSLPRENGNTVNVVDFVHRHSGGGLDFRIFAWVRVVENEDGWWLTFLSVWVLSFCPLPLSLS